MSTDRHIRIAAGRAVNSPCTISARFLFSSSLDEYPMSSLAPGETYKICRSKAVDQSPVHPGSKREGFKTHPLTAVRQR